MQLQRLWLRNFRNLQDIEINFAQFFETTEKGADEIPAKTINSHALIGQNGTGKSNLMEALITIFRDVDLDRDAAFDYELEYTIRDYQIRIKADTNQQKRPYVWVDNKSESQGYLLRNKELLPSHIFAYYSGRNERMEALFQEHQRRFNRRQEITAEEVLPAHIVNSSDPEQIKAWHEQEENKQLKKFGDDRLRRLFY